MATRIKCTSSRRIPSRDSSISPDAFAPFGHIIQNPDRHNGQPTGLPRATANQGTADVFQDVSQLREHYNLAASRKPARAMMRMFVCRPRELTQHEDTKAFNVTLLERHPYTPQTFIPIGIDPDDDDARFLVIVAPTLPVKPRSKDDAPHPPYPTPPPRRRTSLKQRLLGARPNPFTNDFNPSTTPDNTSTPTQQQPKGPGAPDLENLQAFVFRGDQAVTYAPGTWHAPMVVVGKKSIEFVVVQYANDVGSEDCQEVSIEPGANGETIWVDMHDEFHIAAPGVMRAKL